MPRRARHARTRPPAHELVRELADIHGTGFGLTSTPDAVETGTLAALQSAKTTLESKAPDELDAFLLADAYGFGFRWVQTLRRVR